LTSNYSIKGLKTISFLSLVLTSLRHGIQTNKRKQNIKELAKNLLNFLLVMIQTIFSFDIIYFILIFTQVIAFSNIFLSYINIYFYIIITRSESSDRGLNNIT
jgi:hypothetical protein